MRKKLFRTLFVVVILATSAIAFQEFRYSAVTLAPIAASNQQILREMPDIALTEENMKMVQELLAAQPIQAALSAASAQEKGTYDFPRQDAEKLLKAYTPEGFSVLELTVLNGLVCVGFQKDGARRIQYVFDANAQHLEKYIALYGTTLEGTPKLKAIYQNTNGTLTKQKEKHLWFQRLKHAEE